MLSQHASIRCSWQNPLRGRVLLIASMQHPICKTHLLTYRLRLHWRKQEVLLLLLERVMRLILISQNSHSINTQLKANHKCITIQEISTRLSVLNSNSPQRKELMNISKHRLKHNKKKEELLLESMTWYQKLRMKWHRIIVNRVVCL